MSKTVETRVPYSKIVEVATLGLTFSPTVKQICEATGLTITQVQRVRESSTYQNIVDTLKQDLLDNAKTVAVNRLSKMIEPALDVVMNNLKKDNLEAAKMVLKAIGVEQVNEGVKDSQIQIILPGQKQEKDIDSEVM